MGYIETKPRCHIVNVPGEFNNNMGYIETAQWGVLVTIQGCLITIWDILKQYVYGDEVADWKFNNNMGYIETYFLTPC